MVKAARIFLLVLSFSSLGPVAGAQEAGTPQYRLKPSDVVVPQGAEVGKYRRIIQPFDNWTLICDEDLKSMKKVCNIAQTIIGASGETVFSWSLAGDDKGNPTMILRVPPSVGEGKEIVISFPSRKEKTSAPIRGCTEAICLAYLPVGPVLREEIGKEGAVRISYAGASGRVDLQLPLADLGKALASIK